MLHILDGGDGGHGADAGLGGVGNQREVLHVVLAVHLLIAVHSAGLIDPGVVVQGGEVVHDSGQQLKGRVLAGPVAAPVAAALHGALADKVEQLAGGAQFALGVIGNDEPAVGQLAHQLREALVHGEVDVTSAPNGTHLPGHDRQAAVAAGSGGVQIRGVHDAAVGRCAAGQQHGGQQQRHGQEQCKKSLFHFAFSLVFPNFTQVQGEVTQFRGSPSFRWPQGRIQEAPAVPPGSAGEHLPQAGPPIFWRRTSKEPALF